MNPLRRPAALSALVALLALTGCNLLPEPQPDRARYYVLDVPAATSSAAPDAVRVGLRPVEIPAYLKNKALATRSGESEVRFAHEAFWAEPLDAGLTRVVRERLSAHAHVVTYPFPAQQPRDFDLTIRILQAEGAAEGLRFRAAIEVVRTGEQTEPVARREFTAPAATWNGDYAQLAREVARAATSLADDIAANLPKK